MSADEDLASLVEQLNGETDPSARLELFARIEELRAQAKQEAGK